MQKKKRNRLLGCIKKTFLKNHVNNNYSEAFTDQFIEKIKNISRDENYIKYIQALLELLTSNTIQNSILDIKLIKTSEIRENGSKKDEDSESQRIFNFSREREYHDDDNINQLKNNNNIGLKIPPEQIKMLEDLSGHSIGFDQYIEIKLKNRKFCTKISKDFYTKYGKIIPRK